MAKLYFRHGAVSSAKTLNLLAVAHNYRNQGKLVLLMKPSMDVRFGKGTVKSRAGLQQEADVLIAEDTDLLALPEAQRENISCVLVDEAQFLSPKHIDQLRTMTLQWKVPVIAYGLRTDFRANLFPGSRRLMEVADTIEEVKTTCHFCNKKAVLNLKHVNGVADTRGPVVQLGAEETYFPACFGCYRCGCVCGYLHVCEACAVCVHVGINMTNLLYPTFHRTACLAAGQLPEDACWISDVASRPAGEEESKIPAPAASTPVSKAQAFAMAELKEKGLLGGHENVFNVNSTSTAPSVSP
jgi:thymidine kinase